MQLLEIFPCNARILEQHSTASQTLDSTHLAFSSCLSKYAHLLCNSAMVILASLILALVVRASDVISSLWLPCSSASRSLSSPSLSL